MKIPMKNFLQNTQISIRKLRLTNTLFYLVMATTVIVILVSILSFRLIAVNTVSFTTTISMRFNKEYNHCHHTTISRCIPRAETQLQWVSAKSLMSFCLRESLCYVRHPVRRTGSWKHNIGNISFKHIKICWKSISYFYFKCYWETCDYQVPVPTVW